MTGTPGGSQALRAAGLSPMQQCKLSAGMRGIWFLQSWRLQVHSHSAGRVGLWKGHLPTLRRATFHCVPYGRCTHMCMHTYPRDREIESFPFNGAMDLSY